MSVIHPGSSINFDGADLQRSEEEEIHREDIKQQQELRELLSAELPEDLLDDSCEGSLNSPALQNQSQKSYDNSCGSSVAGSWQGESVGQITHKITQSGDAQEYYDNHIIPQRLSSLSEYGEDHYTKGFDRSFTDAEKWQMQQQFHHKHPVMRNNGVGDYGYQRDSDPDHTSLNANVYGFAERREAEGSEDFDAVTHDNSYQYNNSRLSATLPSHSTTSSHAATTPAKNVRFEAFSAPTSPYNHPYGMPYKPINRYQYLHADETSLHQPSANTSSKTDDSMGSDYVDASDRNTPDDLGSTRELTQLRVLYEARGKKVDKLSREIEALQQDADREKRILTHQLAMAQDQKMGMSVTVDECQRMLQERDHKINKEEGNAKSLAIEVESLKSAKAELIKKAEVSERTIENLQQEIAMLQRSDTLERARQQHEAVVSSLNERHEQQLLEVTSMLDEVRRTADVKTDEAEQLRSKLKAALKESEDVLFEKAETINRLSRNLEDAQNHCQTLLAGSGECAFLQRQVSGLNEEKANLTMKAKNLERTKADLEKNLAMYENALQLGVGSRPLTSDGMTESYSDLMGIQRKISWKTPKTAEKPGSPPEDLVERLRHELERALANNKEKRDQVSELQGQVNELNEEARHWRERTDEAEKKMKMSDSEGSRKISNPCGRDQMDDLEHEFQQSLEHLHDAEERAMRLEENCRDMKQQMLEMVEQHDASKQEAVDRCERACMQLHEDAKQAIREELTAELEQKVYELSVEHDGQLQGLQDDLATVSNELSEVKRSYVQICSEKDCLESKLKEKNEAEKKDFLLQCEKDKENMKIKSEKEWVEKKKEFEEKLLKRNEEEINTKISLAKATWMEEHAVVREDRIREITKAKEKEFMEKIDSVREEMKLESENNLKEVLTNERARWQQEKEKELQSRINDLYEEWNEERKTAVTAATSIAQLNWITEQQNSAEAEYEKRISEAKLEWEEQHNRLVDLKVNEALQSMQNKIEVLNEERDRLVNQELSRAEREWKRKRDESLRRKDDEMQEKLKEIQEKHEKEFEEFSNQHKKSLQSFLDKERLKTSSKEKQKDAMEEINRQWAEERQQILHNHQVELKRLQSLYESRCQDFRAEIQRLSSAYDAMTQRNMMNREEGVSGKITEIQRKNKDDVERLKSRMKEEYRRWKRERDDLKAKLEEAENSKSKIGIDPNALIDFREIYIRTLGSIKDGMLGFVRESRTRSVNALKLEAQRERERVLTKLKDMPRPRNDSILLSFLSDSHSMYVSDARNPPALLQNQPSVIRPQPIRPQKNILNTPPAKLLFGESPEFKLNEKQRTRTLDT